MDERKTYAEDIIKKIKQSQEGPKEDLFAIENDIQNGFVVVKYEKLEVEERELIDGKILMYMPTTFDLMDEEVAEAKYPGEDKPDYIYTSEDSTVNITFSIDEDSIDNEEVEEVRDILAKQMQRLYPASKIEDKETLKSGEKDISCFSFEVPLIDGDVYNFMFFMELRGNLLIGAFNCSIYQKKQWRPILKQMLMTLKENKQEQHKENEEG